MSLQIQHLPQDKNPTPEQEWGYTIWEFLSGNMWYIIAILVLLAIFLYARSYMKKH